MTRPKKEKQASKPLTDQEINQAFQKAGGIPKTLSKNGLPVGRPLKYKPEYCQAVIDHFNVPYFHDVPETWYHPDGSVKRETMRQVPNPPPFLSQFAFKLGTNKDTIYDWANKYKPFSDALAYARDLRKAQVVSNALSGVYNPLFSKLAAANWFGWREKIDNNITGEIKSVMVKYHKPDREAPDKVEFTEEAKAIEPPAQRLNG